MNPTKPYGPKYARQTRAELMEHWNCSLSVDHGGDEAGIWCKDHREPIGTYAWRQG